MKSSTQRRRKAGRPAVSPLTRTEQLRLAKRAQRAREARAGLVEARLTLPSDLARQLTFAARQEGFEDALKTFLDAETIEIAAYPQLHLLCWNRRSRYISARDAWSLYERNRRIIDGPGMDGRERALLQLLIHRFGGGFNDF